MYVIHTYVHSLGYYLPKQPVIFAYMKEALRSNTHPFPLATYGRVLIMHKPDNLRQDSLGYTILIF